MKIKFVSGSVSKLSLKVKILVIAALTVSIGIIGVILFAHAVLIGSFIFSSVRT